MLNQLVRTFEEMVAESEREMVKSIKENERVSPETRRWEARNVFLYR
jgi:hypothetical protein